MWASTDCGQCVSSEIEKLCVLAPSGGRFKVLCLEYSLTLEGQINKCSVTSFLNFTKLNFHCKLILFDHPVCEDVSLVTIVDHDINVIDIFSHISLELHKVTFR